MGDVKVNNTAASLLEAVFPQYCLLCQLRSFSPLPLCADCFAHLQGNDHACGRCALPLAATAAGLCSQCSAQPPAFDSVIAPLVYEPHIALLISRWKFQRERRLTRLLALLWLAWVIPPTDRDLLLPVPLHWRRLLWRGFNQAALLGRSLAGMGHGKLAVDALVRTKRTPVLGGLGAKARRRALAGAIRVSGNGAKAVRGRSVILVDDVLTSGATSQACVAALKRAGATRVIICCFARVLDGERNPGMAAAPPWPQSETPETAKVPGAT